MPALLLLALGGAAVLVLASRRPPPRANAPSGDDLTEVAGAFRGVSAGGEFPGGSGGIRSFDGSAESTMQPPQTSGVAGGVYGITYPTLPAAPTGFQAETTATALQESLRDAASALQSAYPSPYAGVNSTKAAPVLSSSFAGVADGVYGGGTGGGSTPNRNTVQK